MKAITLWQPWATLVACGAKRYETRLWRTHYRGPLAIHAASREPQWVEDLLRQRLEPFRSVLREHEARGCLVLVDGRLPRGVVLATATLIDCVPVESLDPGEPERSFGDFSAGRFAWVLRDVTPLRHPVPARGRQMLWEWRP